MTEFSPKAIEQLNQTVREVSRRVRNEAPPRARWQKRKAPASTGGSSGGGGLATNNCCDTIYQAGSVDLDGLEWATDYTITLAAPIGTVTVTDQGSGTWESDAIEVTCTVDEVTVTDEYTVTMTATGNAPGEVIVTVALTLGAGYGGASGCCDTTSTGFAWKFVNCCIVDPLAGWSMTRDPSGFSGKECELGGCEICVTPVEFIPCTKIPTTAFYEIEFNNDGSSDFDGINGSKFTLEVRSFLDTCCRWENRINGSFAYSSGNGGGFPTGDECYGETGIVGYPRLRMQAEEFYCYDGGTRNTTTACSEVCEYGEKGLLVRLNVDASSTALGASYEKEIAVTDCAEISSLTTLTNVFTMAVALTYGASPAPTIKSITPIAGV